MIINAFLLRLASLLVLVGACAFLSAVADETTPAIAPTFLVKDGAFPWSDRVDVWQLLGVPPTLAGSGPVPQQNCSSRSIDIPAGTKFVIFAVAASDADKLKSDFPAAQPTGDSVSVAHADGTNIIPYTVFKLDTPPPTIGDPAFGAGVILLQLSDKPAGGTPPTNAPSSNPK